ncbi:sucrase ferredoxin [Actinospica sp.]|uniref:sucrase ferredoxin n=1 Tax=Actinospica sp. TaxID=1872142 RepID=UPI002BD1CB9F|nr:sucrase ferredoxin [Actinospica sp.]HWG27517.1 sucrase ferredoxin [Actinospica sp.]
MPLSHAAGPAPTSCSAASARLGEPLAGTAPVAGRWLAIEQPGPWGGRALTESHFPHELGHALNRRAEAAGVRIALIRRPGHHAEHDPLAPRRVFLADTRPGRSTLWSWSTSDPATLLDLDFDVPGKPVNEGGPPLLVCTNARRDTCCALSGRALAGWLAEDAATDGGSIWESDHLGGHRFAPTAVVLPTGYVYGRLDGPSARGILREAAAGRSGGPLCRGRSTWSRPGQAAELALRAELQEYAADAVVVLGERLLDPVPDGPSRRHEVILDAGGHRFRAVLAESPAAEPRPESCGKAFGNPLELRLISLEKDC